MQVHNISPASFCVNPWYWLRINSLGEISYCARATDYWSQSVGSFAEDYKEYGYECD
jgi:hypothetical protein